MREKPPRRPNLPARPSVPPESVREFDDAFAHDLNHFRLLKIGVNHLDTKRGRGHINIQIRFFEHPCVFVRRKARPISFGRKSHAAHNSSGFDILAKQNIQIALKRRLSGDKMQRRIFSHIGKRNEFKRIFIFDRRGNFSEITTFAFWLYCDLRISRNINRIIRRKFKTLAADRNFSFAFQTDESGFMFAVLKLQRLIVRTENNPPVMQMPRGGGARLARAGLTKCVKRLSRNLNLVEICVKDSAVNLLFERQKPFR